MKVFGEGLSNKFKEITGPQVRLLLYQASGRSAIPRYWGLAVLNKSKLLTKEHTLTLIALTTNATAATAVPTLLEQGVSGCSTAHAVPVKWHGPTWPSAKRCSFANHEEIENSFEKLIKWTRRPEGTCKCLGGSMATHWRPFSLPCQHVDQCKNHAGQHWEYPQTCELISRSQKATATRRVRKREVGKQWYRAPISGNIHEWVVFTSAKACTLWGQAGPLKSPPWMCTDLALLDEDCSKRGTRNKTRLRLTKECLTRVLRKTSLPNLLIGKDSSQDCDPQMDSPALLLPLRCLNEESLFPIKPRRLNRKQWNSQANCFPTEKPCLCCKRQRKPHLWEGHHWNYQALQGWFSSQVQTLSLRRCSTCSITVFEQTGTNCGVKPVA